MHLTTAWANLFLYMTVALGQSTMTSADVAAILTYNGTQCRSGYFGKASIAPGQCVIIDNSVGNKDLSIELWGIWRPYVPGGEFKPTHAVGYGQVFRGAGCRGDAVAEVRKPGCVQVLNEGSGQASFKWTPAAYAL